MAADNDIYYVRFEWHILGANSFANPKQQSGCFSFGYRGAFQTVFDLYGCVTVAS